MALLFIDGFDAGDFATKWNSYNFTSSSTVTRFSTGRSLLLNQAASSTVKSFTPSAQIYIGFALNVAAATGYDFLTIYGDTGGTAHLNLVVNGTGAITLNRFTTALQTSAGGAMSLNAWNYIEMWATIADAGGRCIVRVNGANVIDFTGDTKNGGTSTNIDTITLGGGSSQNHFFDDLYICDSTGSAPYNTFLGDVRINTLVPSGAGTTTGFTPSAGANYTDVDELPYSAADYVSASTSGTRDTYAMSDLSGSYTILGVQNNVIAKKLDAGGTAIKPAIVSGGTVYYGTSKVLSTSDATITDTRTLDPATSTTWTMSGVNAVEAGMEIA